MSLARFVAQDPYRPSATKKELEDLVSKVDGVIDWSVSADGEVTLEYDRKRISDELIEDALAGIGFRLKHIYDVPYASEAEARQALHH
jgi:copper chaperone CopZ